LTEGLGRCIACLTHCLACPSPNDEVWRGEQDGEEGEQEEHLQFHDAFFAPGAGHSSQLKADKRQDDKEEEERLLNPGLVNVLEVADCMNPIYRRPIWIIGLIDVGFRLWLGRRLRTLSDPALGCHRLRQQWTVVGDLDSEVANFDCFRHVRDGWALDF
jgi:hypothetical protein